MLLADEYLTPSEQIGLAVLAKKKQANYQHLLV